MNIKIETSNRRLRMVMNTRPTTPDALHAWVKRGLGLDVGRTAVAKGSAPPFDYLCHSFFEGGDCVVWANRGGGKTMLGAVATLLDLVFKPGIQVRILGGSLEQSSKMYQHLRSLLDRPLLRDPSGRSDILAEPATSRKVVLANGSRVEILAGSQRSVRGTRVHKLRCDEVEEFDPAVWEAAQLVTRSGACGGRHVVGSVEGLSTMHRPFGLMSQLITPGSSHSTSGSFHSAFDTPRTFATPESLSTSHADAESPAGAKRLVSPASSSTTSHPASPQLAHQREGQVGLGLKVFKWNALDVVARCPEALPCEGCVLWSDCEGRAKHASGFVPVEDLITQRRRTSDRTWLAEMMCEQPSVESSVYPNLDPTPGGRHIVEKPFVASENGDAAKNTSAGTSGQNSGGGGWLGGMDFGLRSPLVMLWARVDGHGAGPDAAVHIVDEYVVAGLTLDRHLTAIARQAKQQGHPAAADLRWIGVDPAGHQRNAHSGRTDIAWLRDAGFRVRSARSRIAEGIEIVRRRLDRNTLTVHPRCTQLIRSLQSYRFDPQHPGQDEPLKDGPDHACDALRYLLLNLERGGGAVVTENYLTP